jgi:iron complex transport system substrate-binding protein
VTLAARLATTLILFFLAAGCERTAGDRGVADVNRETAENPRVVTLSPHLAELVFATGAGDLLVGVSAYTDYPSDALSVPVIGDAFNLDLERLTMLEPDLLLAWDNGTPQHVIDDLQGRGFRIAVITTTSIGDIPKAMRRIGSLTGRRAAADAAARAFDESLGTIRAAQSGQSVITVFYQVDARPLYTVNGDHYLSELIELCGGSNIFADIGDLAPLISVEAVLERDPEVIFASSDAGPTAFDQWDRWPELAANRYGNRFVMPANEIGRATPRLLVGAAAACEALANARVRRDNVNDD